MFMVLVSCTVCLCTCLCMGKANNQEKGKKKTTSQQGKKLIGVPMDEIEPTPSCPACESTVLFIYITLDYHGIL